MVLIVCRHGERLDYVQKPKWTMEAQRPWDSPLTVKGKEQAKHAGLAVKEHLQRFGAAPVTRVFCSPLVRCLETAAAMMQSLGLALDGTSAKIQVDTCLSETVSEAWYRSWGIVGLSDSTWGGPKYACFHVPCSSFVPSFGIDGMGEVPALHTGRGGGSATAGRLRCRVSQARALLAAVNAMDWSAGSHKRQERRP